MEKNVDDRYVPEASVRKVHGCRHLEKAIAKFLSYVRSVSLTMKSKDVKQIRVDFKNKKFSHFIRKCKPYGQPFISQLGGFSKESVCNL